MRLHRTRIAMGSRRPIGGEYDASITVNDVDMDVSVHYSVQSPEPDVGVQGGIEIEGVYFEDQGDIQDELSADQIESLAEEINDYLVSMCEAAEEDAGEG